MYFFIVNPQSCCGKGEKVWAKLEPMLEKREVVYERYLTGQPGDAKSIAGMLSKNCREPRVIVVVGGNGTLNEVLDGLVLNEMVVLGYIPCGTGSDFAQNMNLPFNPYKGLKRLLASQTSRLLDYGVLTVGSRAEHRRFAISAGLGLDGAVCRALPRFKFRKIFRNLHLERLCYIFIGLKQLALSKPAKGYIILDRVKKIEFNHIYLMSAHIHPFEGGGFKLAPLADGSDGKLSVCVVSHISKRKLFWTLVSAFFLRKKGYIGIRWFECREVFFHVERPMAAHADGEDCGNWIDLQAECIEKQLRVMV